MTRRPSGSLAGEVLRERHGEAAGWIFPAADGANDPRDIHAGIAAHREGAELVLGNRTGRPANRPVLGAAGVLGNLARIPHTLTQAPIIILDPLNTLALPP